MSKFAVAVVAAVALSVGFGAVAGATEYKRDYCEHTKQYWQYKKVVAYKTVTDYRHEQESYTRWVTEYDHCDNPYQVKKTFHRTVKVPYKKQVALVTWVKVKVVY